MKILVCVNQVPDTTSQINFTSDQSAFDPSGVQFVLNPSDEAALMRALQLKEEVGAELTLVHVGLSDSEPVLRKAFALGADHMLRIDTFPTDGFFVAEQLAAIAPGYDAIFCGRESLDYNGGMVGGMLAALLDYDFVDEVTAFSFEGDKAAKIIRMTDGGKEHLEVPLPVVVGIQKEIVPESEIRIPSMKGIMMARKAPLEVIPPVEASSLPKITALEKPQPKAPVKMIDPNNLDELIDELHNKRKLF